MKNRNFFTLLSFACFAFHTVCNAEAASCAPAETVIANFIGYFPDNIILVAESSGEAGFDSYTYQVSDGILTVTGTSQVALCRGFYGYVLDNGIGVKTWSGKRCEWPDKLPDSPKKSAVSPFEHHLFYNVCTNGYTTPFWGWDEWSDEIDWLALHGFDMPLAPIAGEAILARVWKDMGLSDKEIDEYFTGPAHMPWMRMGNMTGLDGAPGTEWHEAQINLQHRIIEKMTGLGMTPVFQGFAGFVPKAMKDHYPYINLTTTNWGGFESYMISPLDSIFTEIQVRFITEWEKEFGKGKYYLIDSFNELDIPFGEKGSKERADLLRKYSSTIYNSLTSANPDAVWVMQGWMFGYQRDIWDPESVEALLGGVPDDRLIVIDLAVDFNRFIWKSKSSWEYIPGMYGKEWIYSTTPNFGGRTALIGSLESYMNGHIEALLSPRKGKLTGYGASPEGIEQNEVIYEILSDAGWRSEESDLKDFLRRYSKARYGKCPEELDVFWDKMLEGPYAECTNNARYLWQLRPFSTRIPTMGIGKSYFEAIESFLSAADYLKDSGLYRADAVAYAAMYLAAKADAVLERVEWGYVYGEWKDNQDTLYSLEKQFTALLSDCDRLLESHPLYRLDRHLEMAGRAGCNPGESSLFEKEMRRLVTVWGGPNLSDYSCRLWSGLIRDYYLPRWMHYFDNRRSLAKGKAEFYDFRTNEELFHSSYGLSSIEPFSNPLKAACELVAEASSIAVGNISQKHKDAFGYISIYDFTKEMVWKTVSVLDRDFRNAGKIVVTHVCGSDSIFIRQVNVSAHNIRLGSVDVDRCLSPGESIEISLSSLKRPEELSKEVNIQIVFRGKVASDASAVLVFE